MRKRLQLKRMLTASTLLATSFTLPSAANAAAGDGSSRGIATIKEPGRTIYVNDDVPAKQRPTAAPRVRGSTLVCRERARESPEACALSEYRVGRGGGSAAYKRG